MPKEANDYVLGQKDKMGHINKDVLGIIEHASGAEQPELVEALEKWSVPWSQRTDIPTAERALRERVATLYKYALNVALDVCPDDAGTKEVIKSAMSQLIDRAVAQIAFESKDHDWSSIVQEDKHLKKISQSINLIVSHKGNLNQQLNNPQSDLYLQLNSKRFSLFGGLIRRPSQVIKDILQGLKSSSSSTEKKKQDNEPPTNNIPSSK